MRLRIAIAMLEILNRKTLQSKVNICKSDVKIRDYADSLIPCILPKFLHITDLLMDLQWLPVHQRILLEVLVLIYNLSGIFSIS